MKYLYPYECDKMKLSSPSELQAAIDGNRREGRRPSYGYDFSPVSSLMGGGAPPGPGVLVGHPPPPPPPPHMPHMNGGLFNGRPGTASSSASGWSRLGLRCLESICTEWVFAKKCLIFYDDPRNEDLSAQYNIERLRAVPQNFLHTKMKYDVKKQLSFHITGCALMT